MVRIEYEGGRTTMFDTLSYTEVSPSSTTYSLLSMREEHETRLWLTVNWHQVPDELATLLAEEKEEGAEGAPARSKKIGVTSMKRLCRFLVTALKVTLGFFVWLFLAVFKWVIRQWSFACLGNYSLSRT